MRNFILLLLSFLLYEQVESGPGPGPNAQNDLQYQENGRWVTQIFFIVFKYFQFNHIRALLHDTIRLDNWNVVIQ